MQAVSERQTVEQVEETSSFISSSSEQERHALEVIFAAIGYAVVRVENPAQVAEFLLGCWTRREGDTIVPVFL
jgi:hypothetical protein